MTRFQATHTNREIACFTRVIIRFFKSIVDYVAKELITGYIFHFDNKLI